MLKRTINLELLTEQANGLGKLLCKEFGKKELPDWAGGLMELLFSLEELLAESDEITLTKTKKKD